MERVSVRDLRLKTSALLKNVAQGQTYLIESRRGTGRRTSPDYSAASDEQVARSRGIHPHTTSHRHRRWQDFGRGSDLKRTCHDNNLRAIHIKELRSRVDEGLASLDRNEGTDGEKFVRRMLGGPDLHEAKSPPPRDGGKMKPVATVQVPEANQTPTEDPHYSSAVKRVEVAVRELQEKGIIDPQGRRLRKELPPDMREDADRDFGG